MPRSARVSRAGFGVTPKRSFVKDSTWASDWHKEKFAKAGRFCQHARRARYPDNCHTKVTLNFLTVRRALRQAEP
jgi:hypothetical protein